MDSLPFGILMLLALALIGLVASKVINVVKENAVLREDAEDYRKIIASKTKAVKAKSNEIEDLRKKVADLEMENSWLRNRLGEPTK